MNHDELRAALARVANEEAAVKNTVLHRMFDKIGPTKAFTAIYRRLGPVVDPFLTRVSDGRIGSRLYGFRTLLLQSTGAKSGKARTSPLIYVRDGDDFVVVGTNFGGTNHPAWTANLLANPGVSIEVFGEKLAVSAEIVDDATFERVWPRFSASYAGYDVYREKVTNRAIRMFRLRPRAS